MSRSRRPADGPPGPTPVAGGTAELLADADRDGSWMLLVNDTPQSHVDLEDPTHLEFEYVRRIGHALDLAAAPGSPLDVVHLGGGALTLPRYVAVTRHGSRQRVVEIDQPLTDLVREHLPLPRGARIRVRADDARVGLTALPTAGADVIICDVFAGARTPAHLTTVEFAAAALRCVSPAARWPRCARCSGTSACSPSPARSAAGGSATSSPSRPTSNCRSRTSCAAVPVIRCRPGSSTARTWTGSPAPPGRYRTSRRSPPRNRRRASSAAECRFEPPTRASSLKHDEAHLPHVHDLRGSHPGQARRAASSSGRPSTSAEIAGNATLRALSSSATRRLSR
jgi:hypothetical protein